MPLIIIRLLQLFEIVRTWPHGANIGLCKGQCLSGICAVILSYRWNHWKGLTGLQIFMLNVKWLLRSSMWVVSTAKASKLVSSQVYVGFNSFLVWEASQWVTWKGVANESASRLICFWMALWALKWTTKCIEKANISFGLLSLLVYSIYPKQISAAFAKRFIVVNANKKGQTIINY